MRLLTLALLPALFAQQSQNPSPMVEHTRAHPRLPEQTPPGRRDKLETGTLESKIEPANLQIWIPFFKEAIAGRKRALVTHSEIFPGTFASTTETSDYLVAQLGVKLRPVLKWGPMGTQQLSEVKAGRFL